VLTEGERRENKRTAQRKWKAGNREKVSAYDRERYRTHAPTRERVKARASRWAKNNPERHAETSRVNRKRRYDSDLRYRETICKAARDFRKANPEKVKAQNALNYQIRIGKIVRPSKCSICGDGGRIESHHHKGYAREHWFDVQWVCTRCHKRIQRSQLSN